jgi:hypothetical protein
VIDETPRIPPPPLLTDEEVRGVGQILAMQQILGALAIAFAEEGEDPRKINWQDMPRRVYDFRDQLEIMSLAVRDLGRRVYDKENAS